MLLLNIGQSVQSLPKGEARTFTKELVMKMVNPSGIFVVKNPAEMPCVPHDLVLDQISGSFGNPAEDRVAYRIVSFAHRHNAWVGVQQSEFLRIYHGESESKKSFRVAFAEMIDTELLVVPGLKKGFWSFTNIFRDHIVCPTPILINQLLRHQSQKTGK